MISLPNFLEFAFFAGLTLLLAVPLGQYMGKLFAGEWTFPSHVINPVERIFLRLLGLRPDAQQGWLSYAKSLLIFNFLGAFILFLILIYQDALPLNPQNLPGLGWQLAFNIAVAFTTNTDWQAYSGEATLSPFSQMVGLTVQNFLSAATGLAVAIAVIRGFIRRENPAIGNFYVDVTRALLYVLIPLALILGVFLVSQGSPETLQTVAEAQTLEGGHQAIALGPVASQVAIKILGSNGGGYFNANGAHPFENPNPFSNIMQLVGIVLLPVALVIAFGQMVGDRRQGIALLACMTFLFLMLFTLCYFSDTAGNPHFNALDIDQGSGELKSGGTMEGKEVRFGVFTSTLWASAATATSNGSVNAAIESFTPLATIVPFFNMLVGEVIYGGIGCGLYGILIYVLLTVFIAGLMVGRTPEYLGKKIEAYEIKLAVLTMLLYPAIVLGLGSIALWTPSGAASLTATGAHGLSQMIYAYASAAANNGSAFGGIQANTPFMNITLGLAMLLGRFGIILPVLAIAGSLARKRITPQSPGTLPTQGPIFITLLTGVILLFGGLTYFPVLALGPVAEHLSLKAGTPP